MVKEMLTQEKLKEILHYCPETGNFIWLRSLSNRNKIGAIAGSISNKDYIYIGINNKIYLAHRLAFLYMEGKFPIKDIDHIDNIQSNTKWSNLREATESENGFNSGISSNNTSGVKGVSWDRWHNKWRAYIHVDYKKINLGCFRDIDKAKEAVTIARQLYHGDFARNS